MGLIDYIKDTTSKAWKNSSFLEGWEEFRSNQYYEDREGKAHNNWDIKRPHNVGEGARALGNTFHAVCSGVGFLTNEACKIVGSVPKGMGNLLQSVKLVPEALGYAANKTWDAAEKLVNFSLDYKFASFYGKESNWFLRSVGNLVKLVINTFALIQAVPRTIAFFVGVGVAAASATLRVAQLVTEVVALPLHAVGTALKMVGTAIDKTGSLAQTACTVVGHTGRALGHIGSSDFLSSSAQVWGSATRLITDATSIGTEALRSFGSSVKDYGNHIGDNKGGTLVRNFGNSVNATATVVDTTVNVVREGILVASPVEAWNVAKGGYKATKENFEQGKDAYGQPHTQAVRSPELALAKAGLSTKSAVSGGPDNTPADAMKKARIDLASRAP